ncbi:YARHG domain-containing protein [Butyrivibrio sp. NC3005]|uniref:YARHG domain-containing protein n=1 Tax=Butyrivibrio sp. NC3005 TaxID=1280685 RepID=UPI000410C46A|nr:YARHG domain-containing protein [Butyrivibrio sp. NC3005]
MIRKTKHGYEFSWENWNSIQNALLDESEALGDNDAPDDIDKSLFNSLSSSFLGANQLLAAEFITDEEQIKQDLLCYLISKDNAPIDVAYGVEITKVEKEYFPHAIFHINCGADWNATSIWEHQETYQVAHQVTVYIDYRGREHNRNGSDREITANGSVYRERKPLSKTVYEDKKRVVTDNVQQTSGHIGPREYAVKIGTVTSEIADTVMKWADNYASDKFIEVNDEYFSNYNRIAENLTFDEAEDQAITKAFSKLGSDARYDIPGNRYEKFTLSGHDIRGVKRQTLFLSVYHIFYKYKGKQFECYMSSDGCKDDVIVSNYPTEESIDEKHLKYKEEIEKKKKSHSKWKTASGVLIGVGTLLMLISLFGGGSTWIIAAIVAYLIGLIYLYLCQRDKKEFERIEERLQSFDDNNSKIKEKIYSIIQDDRLNEEERKQSVKELVDSVSLDNDVGHDADKQPSGNSDIAKQVTSVVSGKTLGQSIKDFFFKNGKINILGWACVLVPVFAVILIIAITAGIKSNNNGKKVENEIAEEESKQIVLDEAQTDKDESLQEKEQDISDNHEGGLPEDVYEEIKGTYYSGVNFIAYKIVSPNEIIDDNGTTSETIRIEKYEYRGDSLILYVDTGSIVESWHDKEGKFYLSLMEGGGWDYEKTHCYSTLERISEDTSVTFDEIMDTYYSTKYYVPDANLEKRSDGFVYLVPASESSCLYPVDGGNPIPFSHEKKITKDAQIGLAESYYYDSSNVAHFNYEYYNFYDKIDTLISSGHWVEMNNVIYFKVDGEAIPLCPVITMDPNIQVDLFLEGFQSEGKNDNANPATSEEKNSTPWYGQGFLEGAWEGCLPDDGYEVLKGSYSDQYRTAEFISPTQVRFTYSGEKSNLWNIEYSDLRNGDAIIVFLSKGQDQMSFLVDKDSKGLALHILRGVWEYDFAPEMTLYKDAEKGAVNQGNDDYILPDSSERLLTEADLVGLSKDDLKRARNEIVDRFGRKLNDKELQAYFDAQSWYVGVYDPDVFDRTVKVSDIEQQNMEFIKKYEK